MAVVLMPAPHAKNNKNVVIILKIDFSCVQCLLNNSFVLSVMLKSDLKHFFKKKRYSQNRFEEWWVMFCSILFMVSVSLIIFS